LTRASAPGPRQEAFERVGGRYDVRVLEPSPPAVLDPPFFAGDPVAGGEVVPLDRPGSASWLELSQSEDDEALAQWCAQRWLGPWPELRSLPAAFAATRDALHTLAEQVIAPARYAANGKIGLRFTRQGFGTPFFSIDGLECQIRVEGSDVIAQRGDEIRRAPITTLGAAAEVAGVAPGAPTEVYQPSTPADPGVDLGVDGDASLSLGAWYGFCASVLEQLRSESTDATRVQLWPEHFDLAVDLGDADAGRRANFGGSPGDAGHRDPYLYVGPWNPQVGEFWNEDFGASLSYHDIRAAGAAAEQREVALNFLREGRDQLRKAAEGS
jgi:hypothetical protein